MGIAAAAPCSAATPTNSIALSRLRLEGRVHSDAVGVNSPFTVHSGATVKFFSALQAHRVPHPLEPYCSRERDAVAPTMTREKGWHHPTVSWLSKPVDGEYEFMNSQNSPRTQGAEQPAARSWQGIKPNGVFVEPGPKEPA